MLCTSACIRTGSLCLLTALKPFPSPQPPPSPCPTPSPCPLPHLSLLPHHGPLPHLSPPTSLQPLPSTRPFSCHRSSHLFAYHIVKHIDNSENLFNLLKCVCTCNDSHLGIRSSKNEPPILAHFSQMVL